MTCNNACCSEEAGSTRGSSRGDSDSMPLLHWRSTSFAFQRNQSAPRHNSNALAHAVVLWRYIILRAPQPWHQPLYSLGVLFLQGYLGPCACTWALASCVSFTRASLSLIAWPSSAWMKLSLDSSSLLCLSCSPVTCVDGKTQPVDHCRGDWLHSWPAHSADAHGGA